MERLFNIVINLGLSSNEKRVKMIDKLLHLEGNDLDKSGCCPNGEDETN